MRAIILSPHALCRDALCGLVANHTPSASVVGLSGVEPLAGELARKPADLLIVDVELDDAWRCDPTVASAKTTKVLLARRTDPELALQAHALGYRAMIPKTLDPPLIAAAVNLVLAGGMYFPCLEPSYTSAEPQEAADLGLSPRRAQVLNRMMLGRTNKEIAKELGISVATVKLHVQAVLNTMGARNRTEAANRARTPQKRPPS